MDTAITKLMQSIENCLLSKLERNCEESKTHNEYLLHKDKLTAGFPLVINLLGDLDLRRDPASAPRILSSLLIMYEEMRIDAPWNRDIPKVYPKTLNRLLEVLCDTTFDDLLKRKSFYEPQEVFDACMESIHQKLTPETFKMYPATIEIYCSLLQNAKNDILKVNPQKTLPACLLLIDDYVTPHKAKGLKTCAAVLQSMSSNSFHTGNYYEVVYTTLKNSLSIQYVNVNKKSHLCLMELIRLLPAEVKTIKSGDLFIHTLDQLHTESSLLRKANNFKFTKKLIEIHGVDCVKRKKIFNTIMCENLEICGNVGVADILLSSVLECFEEWIKYCWCVWNLKLPSDQNLLSLLLKVMYININNEQISLKLQDILETLICISTKEDQKQILCSLETRKQLTSKEFLKRLDATKKEAQALSNSKNYY